MPAISRCINCGICALVAGRHGGAYLPDLASAYLRPLPLLPRVRGDLGVAEGGSREADLEAAAAACPVGVPLPALAAIVRRLADS
jgi:ferredoxin